MNGVFTLTIIQALYLVLLWLLLLKPGNNMIIKYIFLFCVPQKLSCFKTCTQDKVEKTGAVVHHVTLTSRGSPPDAKLPIVPETSFFLIFWFHTVGVVKNLIFYICGVNYLYLVMFVLFKYSWLIG